MNNEEILPSSQRQIIKHAEFRYSPLGKKNEKQRKTQLKTKEKSKLKL